nr:MAG TPA: hypothetical protein [Myoviridae sp. ctEXz2]
MVAALKRIYNKTKDNTYLVNAVLEGYITEAEKEEILRTA